MSQLGFPLYVNGQRFDEPVNISHVPATNGLGATVRQAKLQPHLRKTMGEYFAQPMNGADPSGLGHFARTTLLGLGGGLGTDDPAALTQKQAEELTALIAVGLVVRGAAGYFVGKALNEKYKWWGVGAAVVGGVAGLGVLGFIAGRKS